MEDYHFTFKRSQTNKIHIERIMSELERTAKHYNFREFGREEFSRVAEVSDSVVRKNFGNSWGKALAALKIRLNSKGLTLSPRTYSPNRLFSEKELFDEMERIWKIVGQRPSATEWQASSPKISYATYKKRFGGWQNACLKFIEHKMGVDITFDDQTSKNWQRDKDTICKINKCDKRDIPLKIRLQVLSRDKFRCIFCGRSPATDVNVILHIDHITPFSKGGKSVLDNLQTLCSNYNLGKSDQIVNKNEF